MPGDCHIHMVLDGVSYQAAIGHHRQQPDEALIRSRLKSYQRRGITYLRDGGDSWGVSLLAAEAGTGIRHHLSLSRVSYL